MKNLIQKYNIPGPRYTSYPTVPYWDKEGITIDNWKRSTLKAFRVECFQLSIDIP